MLPFLRRLKLAGPIVLLPEMPGRRQIRIRRTGGVAEREPHSESILPAKNFNYRDFRGERGPSLGGVLSFGLYQAITLIARSRGLGGELGGSYKGKRIEVEKRTAGHRVIYARYMMGDDGEILI